MKKSILAVIFLSAYAFRATGDDPAAVTDEATQPATVPVDVPAEHADLVTEAVELLKRGEQWIIDNVRAGIDAIKGVIGDEPAEDPAAIKAEETNAAADNEDKSIGA